MHAANTGHRVVRDSSYLVRPLTESPLPSMTSASNTCSLPSASTTYHGLDGTVSSIPAPHGNRTVGSTLRNGEVGLDQNRMFGQPFGSHTIRSKEPSVERHEDQLQIPGQRLPFRPRVLYDLIRRPSGPSPGHPRWMAESSMHRVPSLQQTEGPRSPSPPLNPSPLLASTPNTSGEDSEEENEPRKRHFPLAAEDRWAIAVPDLMKEIIERNSRLSSRAYQDKVFLAERHPPKPTVSESSPSNSSQLKRKRGADSKPTTSSTSSGPTTSPQAKKSRTSSDEMPGLQGSEMGPQENENVARDSHSHLCMKN
ncbi:hypothetical protein CPB84DRAFT_1802489 [Gymnopilus junonius]|uniref:Uncharacterized protein n=1 Tax=Gymnopilus junonius TaxID=109634 RepID=A0A9P5TFN5_GYMJU|nr:hypothetical protein CPB84DRAFT_1802489 [Gymnopilus junonius]